MGSFLKSKNLMYLVFILSAVFCADMALADLGEPPVDAPWYGEMIGRLLENFPEVNGWFAAVMLFLMGLIRGVADLLGFIATKTETKKDDEIAAMIGKISRWASAIIGWFGLGAPKK